MIFIGIGSNKGDRRENIAAATAMIGTRGVRLIQQSPVYLTPPWGVRDQEPFLNCVAEVAFPGSPERLLQILLQTETALGRRRTQKWGPRIIDLDLLCFHAAEIHSPSLTLPHPWMTRRAFVMVPLAAIAPDFVVPGQSQTAREIAEAFSPEDLAGITRLE